MGKKGKKYKNIYWTFLVLAIVLLVFYFSAMVSLMSISGGNAESIIKNGFFEFGKDGIICYVREEHCIPGFSLYIITERILMPVSLFLSSLFLLLFLIFQRKYSKEIKKQ